MDAHDSVFVGGYFYGQVTFGTNVLSALGLDAFLAKLDRNGNWLWVRQFTHTNTEFMDACAISPLPDGSVLVSGEGWGGTNLATVGTNLLSLQDNEIFVAKFASDGTCLWGRGIGGYDPTYGHGMATDAAGNIYVSGVNDQTNHFLVAKLDSNGNELMSIRPNPGGLIVGHAITLDNDGNIYVGGMIIPPVQIQGVTLNSTTQQEAVVIKFDPSGALLWARELASESPLPMDSWATALKVDSQTNLLVTGRVLSKDAFGVSISPTNLGWSRPYLLKLAPNGSNVWLRTVPIENGDYTGPAAWGLALDQSDNAYIAGSFCGTAYFDSMSLTAAGYNNSFMAACDSSGNFQWAIRDNCTNDAINIYNQEAYYSRVNGLAVGRSAVVSVGFAPPAGTFGPITFTNGPGYEMFIAAVQFPLPRLNIAGGTNGLVLRWPTAPSGYVLQSATNLLDGNGWQDCPLPTVVLAGTNCVNVQPTNSLQFFRLRRNDD
jgi:hypothetical protein